MTETRRRTRWSHGRLRGLAWGAGGAAFILAAAPLVATPKPPAETAARHRSPAPPRRVIERHITRRVIIVDPVQTVWSGSTGSGGGGVTVQQPASSTSAGGAAPAPPPAPAPAPPPTTTTGGS